MELSGNSIEHLNFFIEKLRKHEPFSLIRPGDGEYMILQGKHFGTQDHWRYNGGTLQNDLFDSLMLAAQIPESYVGIPCQACCSVDDSNWYINTFHIDTKYLTYANIVCNKQWPLFINHMIKERPEFYYIGPGKKETDMLKILDRFHVDELQIHRWDTEKEQFIQSVEKWVDSTIQSNDTAPKLFMFSAGPLTKVLIPKLFNKYPNHQFFDCGSALDSFLKGNMNRPYMNPREHYAKQVCDFTKPHIYID